MKQAIVIIEHRRPSYLWLCLHGLFRARGIEAYDVLVDIDQGWCHDAFKPVVAQFPVKDVKFRDDSYNTRMHWLRALKDAFELGYEAIVFLEGDMLLRRDGLEYLDRTPKSECFISLSAHYDDALCKPGFPLDAYEGYYPLGNWIHRDSFAELYDYVFYERYVGKRLWNQFDGVPGMHEHDRAFCFYAVYNNKRTRAADRWYVLHFGINQGLNTHLPCPGVDRIALEARIFQGHQDTWLANLLAAYAENQKPFEPKGFVYV